MSRRGSPSGRFTSIGRALQWGPPPGEPTPGRASPPQGAHLQGAYSHLQGLNTKGLTSRTGSPRGLTSQEGPSPEGFTPLEGSPSRGLTSTRAHLQEGLPLGPPPSLPAHRGLAEGCPFTCQTLTWSDLKIMTFPCPNMNKSTLD